MSSTFFSRSILYNKQCNFALNIKKNLMKTTYLLVTILFLFQCNSVNSQTKTVSSKEKPSDKVDQLIAKYNIKNGPGIAVSVIKDGKIVYKNGFGIANLEYGIPITPSTVFHVASVSKQFTVFSILLLEQEGKLSIDDDIRKYLPEMDLKEFSKSHKWH
jgi:CubicO group peptidase (beta-lactamase class C family)